MLARILAALGELLRFSEISVAVPITATGYTKPMNSDLLLNRLDYTDQSTVGELCIDGEHMCWTLEPTARLGIGSVRCIPAGLYQITMAWSTRFQMNTPHLHDVPGRTFIEIHPGNFPKDTEGCLLVGMTKDTNAVLSSREAYGLLVPKIEAKLVNGPVYIHISGGPEA